MHNSGFRRLSYPQVRIALLVGALACPLAPKVSEATSPSRLQILRRQLNLFRYDLETTYPGIRGRIFRLAQQLGTLSPDATDHSIRPPRNALQTYDDWRGNCLEYTRLATFFLERWRVNGGVAMMRVDGMVPLHIAPYVEIGGETFLLDRVLAWETGIRVFGQTLPDEIPTPGSGNAHVLFRLSFSQLPAVSYYWAGIYQFDHGLYPEAEASFRRSIQIYPSFGYSHLFLGEAMQQTRPTDLLALRHFATAMRLIDDREDYERRARVDLIQSARLILRNTPHTPRLCVGMRQIVLPALEASPSQLQDGVSVEEIRRACPAKLTQTCR